MTAAAFRDLLAMLRHGWTLSIRRVDGPHGGPEIELAIVAADGVRFEVFASLDTFTDQPIWSFASALGRLRGFVIRAGRPL